MLSKPLQRAVLAGATSFMATTVAAIPLSVSYEGADVYVGYEIDEVDSQLVSFEYIFDVGSATDASGWLGTTMDALSVQFGSAGNNSNDIIDTISGTSTNSDNINGEWVGVFGKVSGNGCDGNGSEALCYTRPSTGEGGTGEETIIAADTTYRFAFQVLFNDGVDVLDVLQGEHSIKFLSLKQNENNGRWSTGLQLSESGLLRPPEPPLEPDPVPTPGALSLFGLALAGLHLAQRRRR